MVADGSGGGRSVFPEIRISFAKSAPLRLSAAWQAALLSGVLAGAAALAYLAHSRTGYEHLAADTKSAFARAKTTNADLREALAAARQKLDNAARDRDAAAARAAALDSEADALRERLSAAEKKLQSLDQAQAALSKQQTQNAALSARLDKIQADRAAEEARLAQYKASLEETARQLEKLSAPPAKRATRRGRIRERLGEIWQKLSQISLPQPATTGNATPGDPATGVAALGSKEVGAIERAFAAAGVNITRLLSKFRAAPAEGGPFVPPPKSEPAGARSDGPGPEKLAAIAGLVKMLPLSAPLADYDIGSRFGVRTDPINHRLSLHTGIDMDAPYRAPVYATAPGTVIYAGWLGDYGRAVEIDHGLGIVTLYAHLKRSLVSAGENVDRHAEIGLVGSTGRSTGPHVHYEVRVDGRPVDPAKFLGLARLLPASAASALSLQRELDEEKITVDHQ